MVVKQSEPAGALLDHDATVLASLVRARAVSPRELVDLCLRRIEAVEPLLNACCAVFAEEARDAAIAAERAQASGAPLGPLHGIPVAVKESIWLAGKRAASGSRAFVDFVAPEDAVVVTRLRAAGAIVVAHTTMPELGCAGHTASQLYGVTRNPWNLDRSPGGSSGGSAAAVAAHMVPLALGTDATGSIRKPAAFCGIAAIKPTFGRVPIGPGVARWQTLVAVGPMARSVRDLGLALGVLAGGDPRDPRSLPVPATDVVAEVDRAFPAPPRVAWSADLGVAELEPNVRAAFDDAMTKVIALGWPQEEATPPAADVGGLSWRVLHDEIGRMPAGREHLIAELEALELFGQADGIMVVDAQQGRIERGQVTRAWEEFFTPYDVLVTPTVGFEPPPADADQARAVFQNHGSAFALLAAANLTEQPAVTVPAGLTASGLPFGLQVTGPRGSDARCLAAAFMIERALEFPRPTFGMLPMERPADDQ